MIRFKARVFRELALGADDTAVYYWVYEVRERGNLRLSGVRATWSEAMSASTYHPPSP